MKHQYGNDKTISETDGSTQSTIGSHAVVVSPAPPPPVVGGGSSDTDGDGSRNDACRLVWANLAAYQDVELDEDAIDAVQAHLSHCERCSSELDQMQQIDSMLEREWRNEAPLPFSSQFNDAINSIMAAVPHDEDKSPQFANKRIHARARWVRFAAGLSGMAMLLAAAWTSYSVGFTRGQNSAYNSNYIPQQHAPASGERAGAQLN